MRQLQGTGRLVQLALRLDRARLAAWVGVLGLLIVGTAIGFSELYPDEASRGQFAGSIASNPALLGMYGRLEAPLSIGGLTVWRQGAFYYVLVALMSLLTVTRHTRAAEQEGRTELVCAAVVGRRAPLAAAVATAAGAATVVGAVSCVGLIALGEEAGGALAFGSAVAATGWAFAGVAAVTAQLADNSRSASSMAGAVLAGAFALRAAGDVAVGSAVDRLSWVSPLRWAHAVRPFAQERWWVLVLPVVLTALAVAVADRLLAHRDFASGMLAVRAGSPRAAASLAGPFGLAWRLQRATFWWWLVVMLLAGAVFGGFVNAITQLFDESPQLAEILKRLGGEGVVVDAYLGAILSVFGLLVSAYAVGAALELRSEEKALHAEHVLATATSRWRWALSHLVFAFAAPAVLLVAAGAAAGLTSGLALGTGSADVASLAGAALVHIPAVWVAAGIAVVVIGLLPRWTALAYGALAVFLLLGQVGEAMNLSQAMLNLSPYVHVPSVPHAALTWTPLLWLTAVASGLFAVGMTGFRRRNIGP